MSGVHWRAGKYVLPSAVEEIGFTVVAECFASVEDAAAHACVDIVDAVEHSYDEWHLGIDGAGPLWRAAEAMERAEREFGPLEDGMEDPGLWLREDREARVGSAFVAACDGTECSVHPAEEAGDGS